MATMTTTSLRDIAEQFDRLPDPRCHVNRLHPLRSVIVIAILAILAGSNGPTAIVRGRVKKDLLVRGLRLPHGVPRKDVFRGALSLLNPKAFQACFTEWLKALKPGAMDKFDIDRPVLAIDGKTNRRSHDKAKGLGAALGERLGQPARLVAGQVACDDKSNEITAIPELLRLIDIQGAIITIDAMGTQKEIAGRSLTPRPTTCWPSKATRSAARRRHRLHRPAPRRRLRGHRRPPPDRHRDSARQARDPLLHPVPGPQGPPQAGRLGGLKTIGMATVGTRRTASNAPTSATTSAAWRWASSASPARPAAIGASRTPAIGPST